MSCCYKCEKRTLGCHSSCEEQEAFKTEKWKESMAKKKYYSYMVGRSANIHRMQTTRATNGLFYKE